MDKYYYFAAQLPFLKFGEHSFINRDYFLNEAEKWLSEKDYAVLFGVDINHFSPDKSAPAILAAYKTHEVDLRRQLAALRGAQGANGEYKISHDLQEALSGKNPLEAEREMLWLRWKFIEEIEADHYFDLEFLILYFLKIQIMQRLFSFDKEKGSKSFERLSAVDLKQAKIKNS